MPFAPTRALAAAAASVCLTLLAFAPASAIAAEGECPNEALRVGFSAHLPDCRAYEVVTPETRGRFGVLIGTHDIHNDMETWMVSPNGENVLIQQEGAVQGQGSSGTNEQFEALRGTQGWTTQIQTPPATEAGYQGPPVGGSTPDHRFTFWYKNLVDGELPVGNWLYEGSRRVGPIGLGSLGEDRNAEGVWMTEGGSHVIFTTAPGREAIAGQPAVQLEPNAPPSPIGAIYDRPVGGPTHVVSLLPGNITPSADANYLGSSVDGTGVVFEVDGTIYLRRADAETLVAANPVPGTTLYCARNHPGPNVDVSPSIRWLRNGAPIVGATEPRYRLQPEDEGATIQCQVTEHEGPASTSSPPTFVSAITSGAALPPQPEGPIPAPTPSAPSAGTVETCPSGQWTGAPSLSYQWYSNGQPIAGAMASEYNVVAGDVPAVLQCEVIATNGAGAAAIFSATTATNPAPPESRSAPITIIHGLVRARSSGRESMSSLAGVSRNGARVFYARSLGGNKGDGGPYDTFSAFDTSSGSTVDIANEGEIWPVQISEDGSHAYFISTAVLAGNANAFGEKAEAGKCNLYIWTNSGRRFIAPLVRNDVFGQGGVGIGLGLLVAGINPLEGGGLPLDTSRTTADGRFFAFESMANIDPTYNSDEHTEIYRFDDESEELQCVSCNPSGAIATNNAELQPISSKNGDPSDDRFERLVSSALAHIPNITPDGETIVFNTRESLLEEDEDEFHDVYEWHDGQLSLISTGQSDEPEFLYGMSRDGRDVFFVSDQALTFQDQDGLFRSIYDARIDGGFAPPEPRTCEGEGCQGGLAQPPALARPATPTFSGAGNLPATPTHKKKHKHKKKHRRHAKHKPAHHTRKKGRG